LASANYTTVKAFINIRFDPPRYRNAARGGPSHDHRGSEKKFHATNFVKIGPSVPGICSHTDSDIDRQTDRRTDRHTN